VGDPISFLVPVVVVALAAIPLALKLIPPNRVYGLRTKRTLANRDLWFRANRFAGWALLIASAVSASVFVILPQLASGRSFIGLLVFVVPVFVALVASWVNVRASSTAREGRSDG
jgi:uncharacterized membrane protein